jgi:Cu2+-containing amine oxidase
MNSVITDNISSSELIELLSPDVKEMSNWDTDLLPVSNIPIAKMIKKMTANKFHTLLQIVKIQNMKIQKLEQIIMNKNLII